MAAARGGPFGARHFFLHEWLPGLDLAATTAELPGADVILTFLFGAPLLWVGVLVAAIRWRSHRVREWARRSMAMRMGRVPRQRVPHEEPRWPPK